MSSVPVVQNPTLYVPYGYFSCNTEEVCSVLVLLRVHHYLALQATIIHVWQPMCQRLASGQLFFPSYRRHCKYNNCILLNRSLQNIFKLSTRKLVVRVQVS